LHRPDAGDGLARIQDLLNGRLVQSLLEDGEAALVRVPANPRMHGLPVLGNGESLVDDVDAAKPPGDALGTMLGEVFQKELFEGGLLLLQLADLRLKFSTLLDEPIKLVGHRSGGGGNLRTSHSSLLCDFVPSTFNLRPTKIRYGYGTATALRLQVQRSRRSRKPTKVGKRGLSFDPVGK